MGIVSSPDASDGNGDGKSKLMEYFDFLILTSLNVEVFSSLSFL